MNTSLATGKAVAIVDPKVPTKNIAGPPVYYPPGHELFAKNEQSAAAWRAQVIFFVKISHESDDELKSGFCIRVAMPLRVESTNMKLKVNRKALAKAVEQWFQCVCHYVVPCHVLLCKKAFAQKLYFFRLIYLICLLHTAQNLLSPEQKAI